MLSMDTRTMVLLQATILSISVGNIQIILKLQLCGAFSKSKEKIFRIACFEFYNL